jgi:hypothetical protein
MTTLFLRSFTVQGYGGALRRFGANLNIFKKSPMETGALNEIPRILPAAAEKGEFLNQQRIALVSVARKSGRTLRIGVVACGWEAESIRTLNMKHATKTIRAINFK